MLNVIPITINKAARNMVINHPNSLHGQLIRKVFTRASTSNLMGLPTIGGLGVINSEDESDYDFIPLGHASVLQVENFAASQMMDQRDANNGFDDAFTFLIEPEILPPLEGGFEVKKNDILFVTVSEIVGAVATLAFEIVAIESTSNIPPYTQRYICNRRNHLDNS